METSQIFKTLENLYNQLIETNNLLEINSLFKDFNKLLKNSYLNFKKINSVVDLQNLSNYKNKFIDAYKQKKYKLSNTNDVQDQTFLQDIYIRFASLKSKNTHYITWLQDKIYEYLHSEGYIFIDVNEIDKIYNCFDFLNIPNDHPSRQLSDTFYIKDFNEYVLRPHTSNVQIKIIEYTSKLFQNSKSDLKFFHFGKTYRKDNDTTHLPMFHQVEIMNFSYYNNVVSLYVFVDKFFKYLLGNNIKYKIRSHNFPFTTPSFEIDLEHKNKMLEIAGLGMVSRNMLEYFNIDKKINAFALGFGLERLVMIMKNIDNIHELYK